MRLTRALHDTRDISSVRKEESGLKNGWLKTIALFGKFGIAESAK